MANELENYFHFPYQNGTPLQVVRWSGKRVGGAFGGTSARFTLPIGAFLIELSATANCYVAFGGSAVDAVASIADDASRLFLTGVQVIPVPLDGSGDLYTHIAVIQASEGVGVLQVEKVT